MTGRRDSKSKAKRAERPKLKNEQLKDLSPRDAADEIAGGGVKGSAKEGAEAPPPIIAILIG